MTIKTFVNWDGIPPDQEKIRTQIEHLVSAGVTDGSREIQNMEIIRTWSSVEAAQEWIDFVNSFDPVPVSAKIIQD